MPADLVFAHAVFYTAIFLLGAVATGFLNAVIYRLSKKIPPKGRLRRAFVKLLGGLLSIAVYTKYGASFLSVFIFMLALCLIVSAFIDIDTKTIPGGVILFMLIPSAGLFFLLPEVSAVSHITGLFSISLPMLLIALAVPDGFGGGDIKLMAVCGFALGFKLSVFAALTAVFTGGIFAAFLMASGELKRGGRMAFEPFILFGVIFSLFFGFDATAWYMSLF